MPANLAAVAAQMTADAARVEATSPVLRDLLLSRAQQGAAYARSIAPVGPHAHTLKSGYVDEPGDYRDSIEGTVVFENGGWRGRVIARDWKSRWIEFGTKKMPKQSILQRSRAHLEGQ